MSSTTGIKVRFGDFHSEIMNVGKKHGLPGNLEEELSIVLKRYNDNITWSAPEDILPLAIAAKQEFANILCGASPEESTWLEPMKAVFMTLLLA